MNRQVDRHLGRGTRSLPRRALGSRRGGAALAPRAGPSVGVCRGPGATLSPVTEADAALVRATREAGEALPDEVRRAILARACGEEIRPALS